MLFYSKVVCTFASKWKINTIIYVYCMLLLPRTGKVQSLDCFVWNCVLVVKWILVAFICIDFVYFTYIRCVLFCVKQFNHIHAGSMYVCIFIDILFVHFKYTWFEWILLRWRDKFIAHSSFPFHYIQPCNYKTHNQFGKGKQGLTALFI